MQPTHRPGSRTAIGTSRSAPIIRDATCCRRSSTVRGCRGWSAVLLSLVLGVALGLIAGWRGGIADTLIMRIADVQLSFPAILIALLIDGVAHSVLPREVQTRITVYVLIAAIALSYWVHFARTVRGSTMVERNKEYIQAARVI